MPEGLGGPSPEEMGISSENQQSAEQRKNNILETRNKYQEHATELQKNVTEIQAAKYATVLYRLMDRTGDNPELINAMNAFLNELDRASQEGSSDQQLGTGKTEELSAYFNQEASTIGANIQDGRSSLKRKA